VLWYSSLYFTSFYFFILFFYFFLFKFLNKSSILKNNIFLKLTKLFLTFVIFYFFIFIFFIYTLFDFFKTTLFFFDKNVLFWDKINLKLSKLVNLNSDILNIYSFPFIYIFLLVTVLAIFYCLSYSKNEISIFVFYCFFILFTGSLLFFTDSLIIFFFAYEMLLIPSFFILYKFAKTRRCIEAAYLMFFWTQFGALFLIFSFLYLFFVTQTSSFLNIELYCHSKFEINFLFFCWLIGFGVKLPLWPFYGWLPKAHVEASTNFSIFLSGVLVKFAFFGLLKCLITVKLEPTLYFVYPFLTIGIFDAVFKLFYQIDLKKLVAYSTVVEMHWLTICVISGQSPLILTAFCMLISHALLSTNSFLLVDAVNRRFKTRLLTEISGLNFMCPKLFLACLINCLIFLGFPGSIFFIAEFLFFSFLLDLFPLLFLILVILLYFFGPVFFFRSWMNTMFGLSTKIFSAIPLDLNSKENILFFSIMILMFWLGISWQSFIF
jgi:NADH-quinone oxidoreductase subunit M